MKNWGSRLMGSISVRFGACCSGFSIFFSSAGARFFAIREMSFTEKIADFSLFGSKIDFVSAASRRQRGRIQNCLHRHLLLLIPPSPPTLPPPPPPFVSQKWCDTTNSTFLQQYHHLSKNTFSTGAKSYSSYSTLVGCSQCFFSSGYY